MGIKFNCPNGHKMNVKTFLAGKKGICPKCGVRVTIPQPGTPGSEHADDVPGEVFDSAQPSEFAFPSVTERPTTVTTPVGPPETAPAGSGSSAAGPPGERDPLLESPWAQWYVIIPSGERFGPAQTEVMRQWLETGRVSADCLVWRDGWADWQQAGAVFPQFRNSLPAAAAISGPSRSEPIIPAAISALPRSTTRYQAKQKLKPVSTLLIFLVILLGIVLVVVLWAPWRKRSEKPKHANLIQHEAKSDDISWHHDWKAGTIK